MGGGSGGGSSNSSPPPMAQPIDYAALMRQASAAAQAQYRDQLAAQIEAYPKMERLQLGTVSNIAQNLSGAGGTLYENRWIPGETTGKGKNRKTTEGRWERVAIGEAAPNLYTRRATDQLIAAGRQADELQTVADFTDALGYTAADDLEGTEIEAELNRQALAELQLGRSLTPEQERMAQQAARAGMAARGLGVGSGALAAEILNRDMFASQREADRRNFAGSTNQLLTSNRQNRLGLVSNLLSQSANTRLAQANLRTGLAGAEITIDPYARALAPGAGMGSSTLGQSGQMIGQTWQGANQMAGNVASFNANMQATDRNAFFNRQTALEAARITGGATNNAGWMAMMGGMAQGAGALGGGYLSGMSDRREKTDIKKVGTDPLGLNTYSYRYKGDDRTRTGPMAQEVRKALPEAVETVEIDGKKRLAIRPKVLGQAYADAIAAEQEIMFPDGYVVGSGKA
jgi:hypothetical protein